MFLSLPLGTSFILPYTPSQDQSFGYLLPASGQSRPKSDVDGRLSLARLLNNGSLPDGVVMFMVLFGLVFGFISFLKAFKHRIDNSVITRLIPYLPSGIAFAVGFLNAPSFSLARLIGGYIAYRTAKASPTGETPLLAIVIASGFVLGEGVLSIVTLGLTSAKYGAISCWGCGIGGGGYCSGRC